MTNTLTDHRRKEKKMMSEWIKCTERVPEHEQAVLITVKAGTELAGSILCEDEVMDAYFFNDPEVDEGWYPYFEPWRDGNVKLIQEVTAWMPLPEPYEE